MYLFTIVTLLEQNNILIRHLRLTRGLWIPMVGKSLLDYRKLFCYYYPRVFSFYTLQVREGVIPVLTHADLFPEFCKIFTVAITT